MKLLYLLSNKAIASTVHYRICLMQLNVKTPVTSVFSFIFSYFTFYATNRLVYGNNFHTKWPPIFSL